MTLEQAFLWVHRFFPVSIIPPVLRPHYHVLVARTGRANGKKSGNVPKNNAITEIGENLMEKFFHYGYSNLDTEFHTHVTAK